MGEYHSFLAWYISGLVCYLGSNAPVSYMLKKLELIYGMVVFFNILMQNIFRLQQGEIEKVSVYINCLEGLLSAI